jgi:hypothetical protein
MVETLSIIAAIAMAVSTGALLLLHVLPTGYNPIRDAVSDYAIGSHRALFWTFTTAGAVSGLALAVAAARVLIPVFPTDQNGSRFQTPKGTIHMILAVAIFASIAVAASNLGGTLGNEPAWHAVHGLVDGWLPWVWTDPVCRSTTSESVVDMTAGKVALPADRYLSADCRPVVA